MTGIIKNIICLLYLSAALWAQSQTIVTQQNGRFRICKGSISDSDKAPNKSDYDHNENSTLTLSIPGAKSIKLNFSGFCTEKDNDVLRIFNGKDTFSSLIGAWSGNIGPGTVSSTDSFITLHFKSDKSISCSGWKADVIVSIIKPTSIKFSQSGSITGLPTCKDSVIRLYTSTPVSCDSINRFNTRISGPNAAKISKVKALNCNNGLSQLFELTIADGLTLNGLYKITHAHGYRDYCDSIYVLESLFNFSIGNCPILVELKSNKDTICKGDCIKLTLKATGGDSAKYKYSWSPTSLTGKGPFTQCLINNRKYTIKVEDGNAIPGFDTLDIVVLDPPSAQKDTSICYYSSNLKLQANPPGGIWKGQGIINAKTGEFKPSSTWGVAKVWYQIGSCADTVLVTVTAPYNYENVFCPNQKSFPLYWYGPTGGKWSGPKTTSAGMFTPDTVGTYILTYEWKGCKSNKTVFVQSIQCLPFDTVCESSISATLTFSPKGLYPNYFPGLTNYYYGTYNPSLMGGPKNYSIIYVAQGGCRDTTLLTVLPSDAGVNDTFCPSAGLQSLKPFRPPINSNWKSKGINGIGNQYSTDWYNPKVLNNIDTLLLRSGKCTDRKLVLVMPTQILQPDTLVFCMEDTLTNFTAKGVKVNVPGGIWKGFGVKKSNAFDPRITGVGVFRVTYSNKGCDDTLIVWVKPKPLIQLDTSICINSNDLILINNNKNGTYWGNGIIKGTAIFSPSKAQFGLHLISYRSGDGCYNETYIKVDSLPKIQMPTPMPYCFKDSLFTLHAYPKGGGWFGPATADSLFNPKRAKQGKHLLIYRLKINACAVADSIIVDVLPPLRVKINPQNNAGCYGEILNLQANIQGGIINQHKLQWSHGQTGYKTYYTAIKSDQLIVNATDGCSDAHRDTASIIVHPRVWSAVTVSDTVCRGRYGWIYLTLGNQNPIKRNWAHDSNYGRDTLFGYADNKYRVTITDLTTGCFGDTTIEIPGYQALTAGFSVQKQSDGDCLSPIDEDILFLNQSSGGNSGLWQWGDGSATPFDPDVNPQHRFDGKQPSYTVLLAIQNAGGCTDTAKKTICYKDTVIVFVPNAFTPNADGVNDVLDYKIYGASDVNLKIFNRWGQIIFTSNENQWLWDGTFNGVNCPEGVYAVLIDYKGSRQSRRLVHTSVTLLRPKSH